MNINLLGQKVSTSIQETFVALRHPNYRLYFMGQLVSVMGTWMQNTAQGYLVYSLTKDPAFLGLVGFASGIPALLLTLFGGVVADRMPRRRLMMITQSSMMVLAFILSTLVFTNLVQPWHILIMAFLLGVVNAFDAPTRQSFVVELVNDRKDLTNAIALNAMLFNSSMFIGPTVAGFTYDLFGPGWCFLINGLSFVAVITALALMKIKDQPAPVLKTSALTQLKEGVNYVLHFPSILMIFSGMAMFSIFGMGIMTLMPAWSVTVLHGGVTTNGALLSARGLGALISALMIASLGRRGIKGKIWTTGSLMIPVALFFFSRFEDLIPALMAICVYGWSHMAVLNTSNAMVQTLVEDHLRGRVMSIYTLVMFGASPIGALYAGTMASRIGEPWVIVSNAAVLIVFSLVMVIFQPRMRRMR